MMARRLQQFISMLILAAVLAGCSAEKTPAARFELNAPSTTTITQKSATLTCTFSGEGQISDVGRAGIAWGEKGYPTGSWQRSYDVSVAGNRITGTATGLKPETDYSAQCFIELKSGRRIISETVDFTTPKPDSEVVDPTFTFKLQTSNITATGATLNATVTVTGSAAADEMGFCYAMDSAIAEYGYEEKLSYTTVKVEPSAGDKQTVLSGLAGGGGYIWYFYAVAGGKRYQSAYVRFSTASGKKVHRTGWYELPEEQSGTKLYFAYHMRPDAPEIRNYSVCYSAELHCAIWAAAAMHTSWNGNAGRNDDWQYDPEIPASVQPNLSSSYKGNYSRGHMVASSDRQVSARTNRQTFYYTNMAPQIQNEFNGGIWSKLENLVQDTWTCSDTLYVVTGAHFANRSKTVEDKDGNTCYVPTHFYKVMLRSKSGKTRKPVSQLSAGELQCVGFWFDHFGYGTKDQPTSREMRSVADIEKQTGLKFFPNVPNAPKTTYKASDWGM